MRELKFKAIYQSPDTDEPNEIFISEPYTLRQLMERGMQIDFVDGGYLTLHEMEEKYTDNFVGLRLKSQDSELGDWTTYVGYLK